jgi:hypothetical protein
MRKLVHRSVWAAIAAGILITVGGCADNAVAPSAGDEIAQPRFDGYLGAGGKCQPDDPACTGEPEPESTDASTFEGYLGAGGKCPPETPECTLAPEPEPDLSAGG